MTSPDRFELIRYELFIQAKNVPIVPGDNEPALALMVTEPTLTNIPIIMMPYGVTKSKRANSLESIHIKDSMASLCRVRNNMMYKPSCAASSVILIFMNTQITLFSECINKSSLQTTWYSLCVWHRIYTMRISAYLGSINSSSPGQNEYTILLVNAH